MYSNYRQRDPNPFQRLPKAEFLLGDQGEGPRIDFIYLLESSKTSIELASNK